jgi:adenosylmethionine-8-amino-7-oxononanoate aminotransferase
LGCAAALASLDLFEKNRLIKSLPEKIKLIRESFEKIKGLAFVGDVRQCGLMGGIEIVRDKESKECFAYEELVGARLCSAMRGRGVMMRPLGDVIVVMPPVAIDIETLDKLLGIIYDSIANDLPDIVKGL